MKQEDKELLLIDLCARLPYGVKCYEADVEYTFDIIGTTSNNKEFVFSDGYERNLEQIKPYLRPMSSMTEEERKERLSFFQVVELNSGLTPLLSALKSFEYINWLNAHHFDYRGLIEKGLAIEVTEENNPYGREN